MSHEALELRPVSGNSLKEVMALGAVFKASGYFKDIRDEAQAVTKILYGREMGFTPIVSIMGIYIIEGKPSLSANLLATLVKRSGKYDYRVKENTASRCAILFRVRNDAGQWEDLGESEFTIEEAKTAGVASKDNWRKYPKAMLYARCISAGVRAHCPDVTICPLYVPEELGATVTEDGEPIGEISKPEPPAATVEGRTFTKPNSAGLNSEQGKDDSSGGKPEPAKTADKPPIVETIEKAVAVAETSKGSDTEAAVKAADAFIGTIPAPARVEKEMPGCIGKGEAVNFARNFKDALPAKHKKLATQLEHDFLRFKGYLDAAGEPTAYAIPKAQFYEAREEAEKWARGL